MELLKDISNIEVWILVTVLFILRYAIIAGVFFGVFYVWKKNVFSGFKIQRKFPNKSQISREIRYSILTFIIYGSSIWLFLYWIQNEMTKLYTEIMEFGMMYFVLSILVMIVLHDAYFYWTHRLIHSSKLFKYVHKLHHSFQSPTPWAAFAFHPLEAIISLGIIPIILFLIPYHHWALIIFVTLLTVNNIIIHLGFSFPPLSPFKYQNTSVNHDFHHLESRGNYGLYFTFWDRLMGTYTVQ